MLADVETGAQERFARGTAELLYYICLEKLQQKFPNPEDFDCKSYLHRHFRFENEIRDELTSVPDSLIAMPSLTSQVDPQNQVNTQNSNNTQNLRLSSIDSDLDNDDSTPTNNPAHPYVPYIPEFVVKPTLYQELDELVLEFKGENTVTKSSDLNILLKYKEKDFQKIIELGYNSKQYDVIREIVKLMVKRKGKLTGMGWNKGWGRKVTGLLETGKHTSKKMMEEMSSISKDTIKAYRVVFLKCRILG